MSPNLRDRLNAEFPSPVLRSWEDVAKLLAFTSKYNGHVWLFRGARDESYSLTPKIGRDQRKEKRAGERIPYSLADERAVLTAFTLRARAHVQALPQSNLEWLALAQHHGAPTRLLDWTEGLLSALWFATEMRANFVKLSAKVAGHEEVYEERLPNGCLWCAWDIPATQSLADPFSVPQVGTYRPAHFDRRISAQQSVFTLQPNPQDAMAHENLFKFVVKERAKFELRKRLDAAGVNKRALFPDLAGLGDDLAWRYKNNWLAAYRDGQCGEPGPTVEIDP